jgi:NAD(P)-dependent dehydrogenase (short-subunit alcohol dehydrogenase family)
MLPQARELNLPKREREPNMTQRLTGKVAIVTGGASGFGRATALLFAAEGACVVVVDLDEAGGQEVVDEIGCAGGQAALFVGDVGEKTTADGFVAEAVSRYGTLHVLVNNAGIAQGGDRTWDIPEELWDRVLKTNLRSVYLGSRAAIPAMMSANDGSIINIASIAASVSIVGSGASYAAAKGGILSYTRHVAVELAPTIRVNCVSPGFMRTPMSTGERYGLTLEQQEQRMEVFGSYSPMGRAGSTQDVANAALFLASSESSFITGQELVVDGGHLVRST